MGKRLRAWARDFLRMVDTNRFFLRRDLGETVMHLTNDFARQRLTNFLAARLRAPRTAVIESQRTSGNLRPLNLAERFNESALAGLRGANAPREQTASNSPRTER